MRLRANCPVDLTFGAQKPLFTPAGKKSLPGLRSRGGMLPPHSVRNGPRRPAAQRRRSWSYLLCRVKGHRKKGKPPGSLALSLVTSALPAFFSRYGKKKNAPAGSVFFREGKKGRYGCPPGGVGTSLRAQRSVQGKQGSLGEELSVVTPPSSEVCAGMVAILLFGAGGS